MIVDDYHVLTAGHIAYLTRAGEDADIKDKERGADHFAVYAGLSGGKWIKYSIAYDYIVGGDYVDNCDSQSEYDNMGVYVDGAILTCEGSQAIAGSMHVERANSASDMSGTYYVQGYPSDLNFLKHGEDGYTQFDMYFSSGTIIDDVYNPNYRF